VVVELASTIRRVLITSLVMSGSLGLGPTGYNAASLVFRTPRTPKDNLPLELPPTIMVVELSSTFRSDLITSRTVSGSLGLPQDIMHH
jgi:hypothetical protein